MTQSTKTADALARATQETAEFGRDNLKAVARSTQLWFEGAQELSRQVLAFTEQFNTQVIADVKAPHEGLADGEETDVRARIACRLAARRGQGKAMFLDLVDRSGRIQLQARVDELGPDGMDRLLGLDLGDLIGVDGLSHAVDDAGAVDAAGQKCAEWNVRFKSQAGGVVQEITQGRFGLRLRTGKAATESGRETPVFADHGGFAVHDLQIARRGKATNRCEDGAFVEGVSGCEIAPERTGPRVRGREAGSPLERSQASAQ